MIEDAETTARSYLRWHLGHHGQLDTADPPTLAALRLVVGEPVAPITGPVADGDDVAAALNRLEHVGPPPGWVRDEVVSAAEDHGADPDRARAIADRILRQHGLKPFPPPAQVDPEVPDEPEPGSMTPSAVRADWGAHRRALAHATMLEAQRDEISAQRDQLAAEAEALRGQNATLRETQDVLTRQRDDARRDVEGLTALQALVIRADDDMSPRTVATSRAEIERLRRECKSAQAEWNGHDGAADLVKLLGEVRTVLGRVTVHKLGELATLAAQHWHLGPLPDDVGPQPAEAVENGSSS